MTLKCWKVLFIIGLSFAALSDIASAGDFEDGVKFSINKDYNHAAMSFRKAADSGKADAQFNLGLMYEQGRGVPQDFAQSALWYHKAAEQGHAVAQCKFGKMLLKGQGIKADRIEAYKWFSIANASNKRRAKMDLGSIASQMTQNQIKEAQLRKDQWLKEWLKAHRSPTISGKAVIPKRSQKS